MTRRRKSTIGAVRTDMYQVARILGDVQAVKSGRVGRRVYNRALGRSLGRLFR